VFLSEDTVSKIQTFIKNLLACKEKGEIKFYNSQGSHRVFSLDTAPEYIFKMKARKNCVFVGIDDSMKARYETMISAKTVCRTHQLGLLMIPNAKLFTVEADGEAYDIIAEKKLDLNPSSSAQEQYFEEYASSLNDTIRQLAVFICKTGYSDVEWRNNPVLNNSLNASGQRQIGLIDIEEMDSNEAGLFGGGWGRTGLVRLVNEDQGKIVEEVAIQCGVSTDLFARAYAIRKKEIQNNIQLKKHYATKNIVTGKELIQLDINTLELNLTEEGAFPVIIGYEDNKIRWGSIPVTMSDVVNDVVEEINRLIQEKSDRDSVKGMRHVVLNTNVYPYMQYLCLGVPEDKSVMNEEERYRWLPRIINSLVEKGHLFQLEKINGHGYFIQA